MEIRILFLVLLLLMLWLLFAPKGRNYINIIANKISEDYTKSVKSELTGE